LVYSVTDYLGLSGLKELLLLLLFVAIGILWTYVFVVYLRSHSHTPQMNSYQFEIQSPIAHDALPFVSVIVPVRNKEKHIQNCLLSLLGQDYPNFEVIVIDDNSTDNTLKAIQTVKKRRGLLHYQEKRSLIAVEGAKLKILSLTDKPEGWTGKTWASEQGYLESKGSILLFTDGDIYYQRKNVISLTLSYIHRQNLDVLSGITSSGKIQSFWSKTILPLWHLVKCSVRR
jgi:chlorobactene glucosyltransferase